MMRFAIQEAVECSTDLGKYNHTFKIESYVHITLGQECLRTNNAALKSLVNEFGVRSRNYSYSFKESAPKSFIRANKGSGYFPISEHVMPYLLDTDGRFTTSEENSIVGGMFINRDDIESITSYIEATFPGVNIESRLVSSSYRP